MNRSLLRIIGLVAASLIMVSCGTPTNPNQSATSGLTFRVFISNPLQPAPGGGGTPVLNIVNANTDLLSGFTVRLGATIAQPGLMVLSPNRKFTIVFSAANNSVAIVDNASEAVAGSTSGTTAAINLPGFTQSLAIAPDNATGFAAVPTAAISGQLPGAVVRMNLGTVQVSAMVQVPGAKFVVQSHLGSRLLAMDGIGNTVTIIAPSSIGTNSEARTLVCPDGTPAPAYDVTMCAAPPPTPAFDHPVWAIFSADDATAYIFNCGPECLGTTASIAVLDLNSNTVTATIPVEGATFGLLSGNTLYVAGTPPTPPGGNTCVGTTTLATSCGRLDTVDLGSMSVVGSAIIADGYHSHMNLADGQLFIGAATCSDINVSGEVRGCLSIFNTTTSNVVVAPFNGDVTGIQPIIGRNVVYVVESGELRIYDTTTDALQSTQLNIIGEANDVKLVDQ